VGKKRKQLLPKLRQLLKLRRLLRLLLLQLLSQVAMSQLLKSVCQASRLIQQHLPLNLLRQLPQTNFWFTVDLS
jgi:predicted component of type VI protein secretion system